MEQILCNTIDNLLRIADEIKSKAKKSSIERRI
jgi:hypothetical protein